MKHRPFFVLMLLVSVMLSAFSGLAATEAQTASGTRQVEADNGTIEVPADPQRVATIGNTTLPFIDLGGKPIAVTAESDSDVERLPEDQQATYASATILAASADEVDMEALASLQPDLILVQVPGGEFEQIKAQLEAIAPTVFWGLDTEWKALADGIAEAGNLTETLGELKAELEERIAGIQENYGEIIADTSFVDVIRWSSSDPGTFAIADIGCSEIARDDVGLNLPEAAEGADPLAWTSLSFEQIGELSEYDVILYPVDAEGQPTEPFVPVVETNSWQALPQVNSGHALGVFCSGNNSYGAVLRYLDSLDRALATLPTAATEAPAASGTRQVEADNGLIEVPANPQRVAAIGNASLPFIDLGGEPVGVTTIAASRLNALSEEQQAVYDAATNLGPSGGEVDLELLASVEPDLIIISVPDGDFEQISEQLQSIAPTVFVGFNSDWKFRASALAEAANQADALNDLQTRYEEQIATIKEEHSEILANKTFINVLRFDGQDPGMFLVGSNCALGAAGEEVGLNLADGEYEGPLSYEQLAELSAYDVILYPLDGEGQVQESFIPVVETNTWQALPAVDSGNAQGVYCPGEMAISFGFMLQYLDSLDRALATLPAQ